MNVEETPVPEAVCWANDVLADAGGNRHEATPGDTWCSLSRIELMFQSRLRWLYGKSEASHVTLRSRQASA
jgi:hypothetical protein